MTRLPSFFVVGAQKAGTTTLHNWLSCQPEICLPKIKETHFFSQSDRLNKGIGWYLSQFEGAQDAEILGEIDPDYAFYKETPYRIKKFIQNPRFIFIFRHPLKRAYSHYRMSVRRGFETLEFDEALTAENQRYSTEDRLFMSHFSYMARGRYAEQVSRYNYVFPGSEFLYINFDDLFHPTTVFHTYNMICEFIGLRSTPIAPNLSQKYNRVSKPRSILLQKLLYKDSFLKRIFGSLVESEDTKLRIAIWLEKINSRPLVESKSDFSDVTVSPVFWDYSIKEIQKLESLTGLKLNNWH